MVAVKFLETIKDGKRVERFEKEVEILRSINHPHVIKILDLGEFGRQSDPIRFFVMEYQPRNLQREIGAHPRGLHPDIVLPLCMQMGSALASVHEKDIAHRDLKPSNVLFDGTNVKIADFGIARYSGSEGVREGITGDGERVAPRYYMSPEQWRWWKKKSDEHPGKESDVYQFGLIMYQLMTGYNPNTVWRWRDDEKPKEDAVSQILTSMSGSLANDVAGLVREMLAPSKADRPSMAQVQERLLGSFRSYSSHYSALYGVQPGREY